jgi:hypothetical protein
MPAKIILTVEDDISEEEQKDLQYLLSDALMEFATRRHPAKDYVANRYPDKDTLFNRLDKVAQVERRSDLARKLHNAALSPEVLRLETPVATQARTCETCGYDVPTECDGLKCRGLA